VRDRRRLDGSIRVDRVVCSLLLNAVRVVLPRPTPRENHVRSSGVNRLGMSMVISDTDTLSLSSTVPRP
jgi:hypothetical protein